MDAPCDSYGHIDQCYSIPHPWALRWRRRCYGAVLIGRWVKGCGRRTVVSGQWSRVAAHAINVDRHSARWGQAETVTEFHGWKRKSMVVGIVVNFLKCPWCLNILHEFYGSIANLGHWITKINGPKSNRRKTHCNIYISDYVGQIIWTKLEGVVKVRIE